MTKFLENYYLKVYIFYILIFFWLPHEKLTIQSLNIPRAIKHIFQYTENLCVYFKILYLKILYLYKFIIILDKFILEILKYNNR